MSKEIINAKELDFAESAADDIESTYTLKFKKPFEYQGVAYEELVFNWGNLTGKDGLAIENELQHAGKTAIVPAFSGEYLIRFASKACTSKIGSDAFEMMSIADFNKVRSAARSFLLMSER